MTLEEKMSREELEAEVARRTDELTALNERLRAEAADRRRVEEALRENQELLTSTNAMAQVGGWQLDIATGQVRWTNEVYRIHDMPVGEPLDLDRAISFYPEASRRILRDAIGHAIEHGEPYDLELQIETAKGKRLWVRTIGEPVREAEKIVRLAGTFQNIDPRKRAERAHSESERRLQLAMDGAREALYTWNLQTGEVFFSPRWFQMLGYPADSMPAAYSTWAALLHPDDRPTAEYVIQNYLARRDNSDEGFVVRTRMRTADGNYAWVESRGRAVERTPEGEPVLVAGTNTDISDRMEMEAELQESREQIQMLMDHITDHAIYVIDPEGRIASWSRGSERASGYPAAAVLGRPYSMFFTEEERRAGVPDDILRRTTREGHAASQGWRIRHDGERVWVESTLSAMRDPSGKLRGIAVVTKDLTERRRYEEAILRATDECERTFEAVPDLIALIGPDHRIMRVNRAMAERVGLEPEECVGLKCHEIIHGESCPARKCPHAMLLHDHEEHTVELHEPRLGGHFLVTAAPLWGPRGEFKGSVHVARDITDRIRTEEALREARAQADEANRAKSRFLSMMSHELRTPLNGILGFADLMLLQGRESLEDRNKNYLANIRSSGKHLLALINDLLDVAKIDAERMELSWEDFPTVEAAYAARETVASRAEQKHIDIVVAEASGTPWLRADRRLTHQLLLNLLSNAVKFSPKGASVAIEIQEVETTDQVRIAVSDEGPGIGRENRDLIFSEFYQVDQQRDSALGGTGLGLALCRRIANLHGGRIGVDSEPGQGSCFWVELPRSQAHRDARNAADPAFADLETMPSLAGRRILVAEDNEMNQELISAILESLGLEFQIVPNGEEALRAIEQDPPDLVLMDMRMPKLDGQEATRRLRRMPGFENLPVVALTASAGNESREACLAAGCNEHLTKPIELDRLKSALERFLAQ